MKKIVLFIAIVFSGMLMQAQTMTKSEYCKYYTDNIEGVDIGYEGDIFIISMPLSEVASNVELPQWRVRTLLKNEQTINEYAIQFIKGLTEIEGFLEESKSFGFINARFIITDYSDKYVSKVFQFDKINDYSAIAESKGDEEYIEGIIVLILLIIFFLSSIGVGKIASAKYKRSGFGWFVLSNHITPILAYIILIKIGRKDGKLY